MKNKIIGVSILLLIIVTLAACSNDYEWEPFTLNENETIEVFTTIYPLQEFTERIGGDHVNVTNIVPVGADAHTFEPTSKTMVDASDSHLYIYNGAGIEGFADSAAKVLQNGNVKIVKAIEGIELIDFDDDHHHHHGFFSTIKNKVLGLFGHDHDHDDHHNHGDEDPHVWLDPIRAISMAENIKEALITLKPSAQQQFERNFEVLKEQLIGLDDQFLQMLTEISRDTFIVSHAGYGYWTDRYGINQIGISGISPTNEPSIRQIQEIIDFVQENSINYIIFEQNIPTRISESVKNQVGAEALFLHNLEALVDEDVANSEDYFSLMERNIETLKVALQ